MKKLNREEIYSEITRLCIEQHKGIYSDGNYCVNGIIDCVLDLIEYERVNTGYGRFKPWNKEEHQSKDPFPQF